MLFTIFKWVIFVIPFSKCYVEFDKIIFDISDGKCSCQLRYDCNSLIKQTLKNVKLKFSNQRMRNSSFFIQNKCESPSVGFKQLILFFLMEVVRWRVQAKTNFGRKIWGCRNCGDKF